MQVRRRLAARTDLLNRSSLLSDLRLGGQASIDPALQSAFKRIYIESVAPKELRHTGAGMLLPSGAVGDDLTVNGQLAIATLDVIGRHSQGARNHTVEIRPGAVLRPERFRQLTAAAAVPRMG